MKVREVDLRKRQQRLRVRLVRVDHTSAEVVVGDAQSRRALPSCCLCVAYAKAIAGAKLSFCGVQKFGWPFGEPGGAEGDSVGVCRAGRSGGLTIGKERIERDGRSDLLTVLLIGNAEINVTQAKCKRQLRS